LVRAYLLFHEFLSDYNTSLTTCLIQEYLLQGSSLFKITITAILSTVTLTILQTKNKLSKSLFYLYFFGWIIFPLFCLPLSIYSSTGSIYCQEDKNDSRHLFACMIEGSKFGCDVGKKK
jgi:hypothetical protein